MTALNTQPVFFSLEAVTEPIALTSEHRVFKLADERSAARDGSLGATQRSFAEVMAIAGRGPQDQLAEVDESRQTAEQLVATTLVEPILKQLRESNNAPPPFGPGKGEQQFRAMTDAHTAKEIVRSGQFGLVERLAQDMREHSVAKTEPARVNTQEDAAS